MPIGFYLVIDEANGGDATALEVIRRFSQIDRNSGNAIDYFFPGWEWKNAKRTGIRFNLDHFENSVKVLESCGVAPFGGNCDLILVDLECNIAGVSTDEFDPYDVRLRFPDGIRLNLSKAVSDGKIKNLGNFLSTLDQAARAARTGSDYSGPTARISDYLGRKTLTASILDSMLDLFTKIHGFALLSELVVRKVGDEVRLEDFCIESITLG